MLTVLRYDLPTFRETNVVELSLHAGSAVIHVDEIGRTRIENGARDMDKAEFDVHLWACSDTSQGVERRRFWLVRDGDNLTALGPEPYLFHVASWRSVNGTLWNHLFEITHVPGFEPPKRVVVRKGGTWRTTVSRSPRSTRKATGSA